MNKRKIYERTFKENAVQLSMERSDLGNLACELGISVKPLYNWRNKFKIKGKENFPGNGKQVVSPQAKDLLTLQKEYARLQQEHEILKKAIGIISKSGLWSMNLSVHIKTNGVSRWCVKYWKYRTAVITGGPPAWVLVKDNKDR